MCLRLPTAISAQTPAEPSTPQDQAVRMFLDCQAYCGDYEFFRTELPWVNHVRDQRDADRTTEAWKFIISTNGNYSTQKFVLKPKYHHTLRHFTIRHPPLQIR